MNYILSSEDSPPIQPDQINTKRHFWSAFGHSETEISANWIVRFCQFKGDWLPFSLVELTKFYQELLKKEESFRFNRLVSHSKTYSYVLVEGDRIILSKEFVGKCYSSSPV